MPSKKQDKRARAPGAAPPPPEKSNARNPASANTFSAKPAPGAVSTSSEARELTPIPAFTPKGLTPLKHRFCQEYLIDLNGTKAYLRASPDVTYDTASVEAYRLLNDPQVSSEIQRLMDERAAITGITADRVLFKLWERATADPRELVEYRIGSCRYCHGLYNQYQYTDAEFSKAQDEHIAAEAKRQKKEGEKYTPRPFAEKGGSGYDPNRPPNPECPECWGDGQGRHVIHDTRHLSSAAASLYAGVKITKEGLNIQMHSPTEALQLIGRHLGMWNDKLKLVDETNPLLALLNEIQAAHSTLPIVHDDPELKRPGEVQDVESRPASTPPEQAAPGAGFPMAKPTKWRKV